MNNRNFSEEDVSITVSDRDLNGILTLPNNRGPHPAIVLLHGADRSGKEDPYYKEHAENLVLSGFAVLRYDGPGWGGGRSQGPGFETFEYRVEEAIAVINYLQSRPDIQTNGVGLWGFSQGGWICQMTAAKYKDVAFIITISGPGVTPAEQEVYRVEAESKAAGFDKDDVSKAVLMRRLMVDIVLVEPVYQEVNQSETKPLNKGPWRDVMVMTYGSDPIVSSFEFTKVMELLNAVRNERWAKFLHLDLVLPMFESLPPDAWEMAKGQMRAVLEVNPADFLTKVHCPVLAIYGEADTSVPVDRSVALYQQYLHEAGNEAVTIKVFPKAGHTLHVGEDFAPDYFETIHAWLAGLP